jgi:DNA invertase Pin-like site-specific DNA recombinase
MSKITSNQLRFAALPRVSTEQQEKKGESLTVQRAQLERDIRRLEGTIAGWYGGQEHATAGWERKEIDRLIADAAKGKFNAVMVAYVDRWSRDNAKSKEGLEVFRKNGVRFFVGMTEMNLFDPQHTFVLGMNAEVGEFLVLQQLKRSLESRSERLRRGIPAAGKIPFGRTFNRVTGEWGLDPKKRAIIVDVANRYLSGEPLPKLAQEYGVKHSQLCLTLRERCGTKWVVRLDNDKLNFHEVHTLTIPALLDERTIRLVKEKLKANRTYIRSGGRRVHDYLLSGRIFCAGCGYTLCGSTDQHGVRHYNHTHAGNALDCQVRPRPWVRADWIEEKVIGDLFDMFGNPAAIERAVQSAIPDCAEEVKRRLRLEGELTNLRKARSRLLNLVVKGAITEDQAEAELTGLKEREELLGQQLDKLAAVLADVPDPEAIRCYVEKCQGSIFVFDDDGNEYAGGNDVQSFLMMTQQDKMQLLAAVFDLPLAGGTPAGVYISPPAGAKRYQRQKPWAYRIRGRLEFEKVIMPSSYR